MFELVISIQKVLNFLSNTYVHLQHENQLILNPDGENIMTKLTLMLIQFLFSHLKMNNSNLNFTMQIDGKISPAFRVKRGK